MFSVKHNECVGFESRWKVKKVSSDNTTQTTEFSVSEKGCNTLEQQNKDMQTCETNVVSQDVDMDQLAAWLNRIYPQVKKQLDTTSNSRVFSNYRLLDDTIDATCKLVQNFKVATMADNGNKAIPIVSSMHWNHTGKLLAVACNFKHRTWCHHTGLVLIYTTNRDETLNETPKKKLSTESCVTALAYHSASPSIVAAATFNGQIYIWNIENNVDPTVCCITAHEEFITQISWVNDVDSAKSVLLATSSTDGLLKLWNLHLTDAVLKIKSKFKIKTPVLGRINQTEVSKSILDQGSLGVVCFDFSRHIPDMFVVALEGGLIVRCSVLGANQLKGSTKDEPLFDPVYKYYDPHKGEIIAVQFSLAHKNMFLTSDTSGEIRIYLTDQDEPAKVIFTKTALTVLSWINHEEKLIAGCGQNGTLEVFHLINGNPIEITLNTKLAKRLLISLAVNDSKTNYVAMGDDNGGLQIWDVPWQNIEIQNRR